MNEIMVELMKKEYEKKFELLEKLSEMVKEEQRIRKITKRNNIRKSFNKIPFINLKLEEVPEQPTIKIMGVQRPTIKEYERQ